MSNSVSVLLKSKRKELGFSAQEAVDKLKSFGINISIKTLYGWEAGTRQPDADTFIALCQIYGIDSLSKIKTPQALSQEAINIAKNYDTLDTWGKKAIRDLMKNEIDRSIAALAEETKKMQQSTESIEKIVYVNPAAAGVPLYAEDDFERIEFPASKVPKGTDFGVRISGDSMEPNIPDRAIVWVRKTPEIYDGQVGVFMIDNMAVCKRYHKEGKKIVLQSDNPAYEPIEITDFERFGIVGKVIGMTEEE